MPEHKDLITVHVNFPLKAKPPFKNGYPSTTLLAVVLEDAKSYFEAAADGQTQYHFSFRDTSEKPETPLSVLAGSAKSIELVLIKDMISG